MTISVPFNHKVVMVKIRRIFQLILAVYFLAFYFTKTETHILLFLLTPYEGSAPVPRWRLPSPRPPAVSPTMGQIDAYVRPTCNSALNAKYYTTATARPGHVTCVILGSKSDRRRLKKLHKQTDKQTDTTKIMVTWP